MTRSLRSLRCALLLGGPLLSGCASILGDYELVGGSGGSGGAGDVSVSTSSGVFSGVGGAFAITSSVTQSTGASDGGGGPIDPADSDPCGVGSTISMKDNFNDGATSPNWNINPGSGHIQVTETNNRLQVTTDGASGSKGGYQWGAGARSLVGCHVSVEVNSVASTNGSIATMFNLVTEADPDGAMSLLSISQTGSTVRARMRVEGSLVLDAGMSASSNLTRWWRIRERDGVVIFEASPDAVSWLRMADSPAPPFLSAIRPQLFVEVTDLLAFGGTATFDNFNTD